MSNDSFLLRVVLVGLSFWIVSFFTYVKMEGGLKTWFKHLLICGGICWMIQSLTSEGYEGWSDEFVYLFTITLNGTIAFIWGLVLWILPMKKRKNN